MSMKTTALTIAAAGFLFAASHAGAQSRIEVGQQAPDFTLESSTGQSFQLSSRQGEKTLLVFFRGTW